MISTLLIALLSFLNYSPDPQVASDIVAYADQAKTAVSMKNWLSLGTVVIAAGAYVYTWLTGRNSRASTP